MANKVRFGLSNVVVFPITANTKGNVAYGDKIEIPGAVTLKLSPVGDTSQFYADNKAYHTTGKSVGYEGELEIALIPDDFALKCLGVGKDQQGAIIETINPIAKKDFAMAFQFEGDESATKHILYYCTATKSDTEAKTTEDKVDISTETLKFTATADANGNIKAKVLQGNNGYDSFFNSPYQVKPLQSL